MPFPRSDLLLVVGKCPVDVFPCGDFGYHRSLNSSERAMICCPTAANSFGRILQFVEHGECFPFREMGVQQLHDLVVIRTHGSELSVQLRQFGYVFQRSAVGFYHSEYISEDPCFDKSRLRQQPRLLVHRQKSSVFFGREVYRETVNRRIIFRGRPPRPLRAGLFCSIIEIFEVRLLPRRLLKIAIRSWRSRLSKSADFGGAFISAGKLFSDAKNFLCSRKHSLLFALCKYVPSARRTDY